MKKVEQLLIFGLPAGAENLPSVPLLMIEFRNWGGTPLPPKID